MIKQHRHNAPKWLTHNYKRWGNNFRERKLANANASFNWPQYKTKRINVRLVPILSGMTNKHCSFCDSFPMGEMIPSTIEHFKPKDDYPALSCDWYNLYICCGNCQQKGNSYSNFLLRPDAPLYHFDKYFIYNYRTGILEINPDASPLEKKQADETIRLYKLNDFNRPQSRKRELKKFEDSNNPNVNDFAYRYMYL